MTVYEYMRMRIEQADGMSKVFAAKRDTKMYDFWLGVGMEFRRRLEGMTVEQLEEVI